MTEEKVAPNFYVPRSSVEESSTKKWLIATTGDIPAKGECTQSSGITKTSDRRFFEAATVWDWGDQRASYSGKEYSQLFEEIMGALTWVPRSANSSVGRSKNLFAVQRKLYQHYHSLYHRQHQQHSSLFQSQYALSYTNFWQVYSTIFRTKRHKTIAKNSGLINYIERFDNNTMRQGISMLGRIIIWFFQEFSNHIGAIAKPFDL
jgi:hypothetical protein